MIAVAPNLRMRSSRADPAAFTLTLNGEEENVIPPGTPGLQFTPDKHIRSSGNLSYGHPEAAHTEPISSNDQRQPDLSYKACMKEFVLVAVGNGGIYELLSQDLIDGSLGQVVLPRTYSRYGGLNRRRCAELVPYARYLLRAIG